MNIFWLSIMTATLLPLAQPGHAQENDGSLEPSNAETTLSVDSNRTPRTVVVYEPISRAWPMRVLVGSYSLQLHRPEFERWEGMRVEGRMQVVVDKAEPEHDAYGSVKFSARALQKTDGRTMVIDEFVLQTGDFPTLTDQAGAFTSAVRNTLALRAFLIDTERMTEDLSIHRMREGAPRVSIARARISVLDRDHPALLIFIDGEAMLRQVPDTGFMRVINSRALFVLATATGRYYLWAQGKWWEAGSPNATWRTVLTVPAGLNVQLDQMETHGLVDSFDDDPRKAGTTPEIIVSTTARELLQSDGSPQYSPIEGT